MISYSVAIRTMGTAGEKYQKLLDSIATLDPKPEKVIVVLPEGYALPKEQNGMETFVFSQKGMIAQRMKAMEYITSEYILFCDDDVEFSADFVRKLADPLITGSYACSAGPLLSFFPPKGFKYTIASLLGGACTMLHGRNTQYVRLLNTAGWSYNRSIETDKHLIYDADSLAWTCFLAKRSAVEAIRFDDECYLDSNGYAAFDDQTFFCKLNLNQYPVCVVSDAVYVHNDAKTSVQGLKLKPHYAYYRNRYIFWHRFIYSQKKTTCGRLWARLCLNYSTVMNRIYDFALAYMRYHDIEYFKTTVSGHRAGREFVKSQEYTSLPSANVCGDKS